MQQAQSSKAGSMDGLTLHRPEMQPASTSPARPVAHFRTLRQDPLVALPVLLLGPDEVSSAEGPSEHEAEALPESAPGSCGRECRDNAIESDLVHC
jgi:hypothetical protein